MGSKVSFYAKDASGHEQEVEIGYCRDLPEQILEQQKGTVGQKYLIRDWCGVRYPIDTPNEDGLGLIVQRAKTTTEATFEDLDIDQAQAGLEHPPMKGERRLNFGRAVFLAMRYTEKDLAYDQSEPTRPGMSDTLTDLQETTNVSYCYLERSIKHERAVKNPAFETRIKNLERIARITGYAQATPAGLIQAKKTYLKSPIGREEQGVKLEPEDEYDDVRTVEQLPPEVMDEVKRWSMEVYADDSTIDLDEEELEALREDDKGPVPKPTESEMSLLSEMILTIPEKEK
ncbi:hypothetical protein KY362_07375 [Candidatus Woesearchaeota archaeon]|nr:hypothetical protein [Candidatus Woesearchaeota archaeon]